MNTESRLIFSTRDSKDYLDGTKFDDDDLASISQSTVTLKLELSKITDEGIKRLPLLPKLKCLDLDGTSITNEAMKVIGTISTLKELWIEQTAITDDGIKHLLELNNLEFISIVDTEVSDVGVELLRNNIDGIEID